MTAQKGSSLNGSSLNGSSLNGSSLNGSSLNGNPLNTTLASVAFAGLKLNGGGTADAAWLVGTELHAKKGSTIYRGVDLKQAELQGTMADGRTVRLRLRSVTAPPTGDDRWRYGVEYRESDNTWWPVCKQDGVGAVDAYALSGTWSYAFGTASGGAKSDDGTKFTFACTNGASALAKCVDLGYKPWTSFAGVNLENHHQACVRLIRADYCGDGTSYTADGTPVNLYDGLGIQTDDHDWYFEAEWDERGARCFSPLNRSHEAIPCYQDRVEVGCGSQQFPFGTLLVNETTDDGIL
ncbi:MAG TPA: ADYC domain-containing protein [Actinomycetota bacterium]|nr:ADYC domain-containing protein [Actinomycetota bacterium]